MNGNENEKPLTGGCLGCLGCLGIIVVGFFGLIFILIVASFFGEDEKSNQKTNQAVVNERVLTDVESEVNSDIDWKAEIKKIGEKDISSTRKYEEATALANDYTPTEPEMISFFADMINDYESRDYITQLDNEIYALENIFKSYVVHLNASNLIVSNIGFDYWQNVKYVYRGVDAIDSDAVESNNYQIEKGLIKLQENIEI